MTDRFTRGIRRRLMAGAWSGGLTQSVVLGDDLASGWKIGLGIEVRHGDDRRRFRQRPVF